MLGDNRRKAVDKYTARKPSMNEEETVLLGVRAGLSHLSGVLSRRSRNSVVVLIQLVSVQDRKGCQQLRARRLEVVKLQRRGRELAVLLGGGDLPEGQGRRQDSIVVGTESARRDLSRRPRRRRRRNAGRVAIADAERGARRGW